MHKRYKKNLFLISFLILLVITLTTATGQQQQERENFTWIVDGQEAREGDVVLIREPYFMIFTSERTIEIEYRCLENESKIYEERRTSRNVVQLRTEYNSELTIRNETGEIIKRTQIKEPTARNIAVYEYNLRDFERVISTGIAFVTMMIIGFVYYYRYERRLR